MGARHNGEDHEDHCEPQCFPFLHYNSPYELYDGFGFGRVVEPARIPN
jgi:hypothetical protein